MKEEEITEEDMEQCFSDVGVEPEPESGVELDLRENSE